MSSLHLDELVAAAARSKSESDASWTHARSTSVLTAMLARRDRRAARAKLLRRGAIATTATAAVVLIFLRGLSAPVASATPSDQPATAQHAEVFADLTAASTSGDGGYARD